MENENKELELSERQLTILDAIIRNYLATGEPVGSRTISKYTDLNLSSATIRNEMSDLEEMGYIVQPHTSAGRIPSDKGYRLYVDHLIETNDKKEKELSDMKELVIENTEKMEQVLKQAAKVLANNTNYATLVSAPDVNHNKVKFIQLSQVDDQHLLAVIVMNNNMVRNKMLDLYEPLDNETILKLNILLNTSLNGLAMNEINLGNIASIKERAGIHSGIVSDVIDALAQTFAESEDLKIYTSGATNILKYPELSDSNNAATLLSAFEEKEELASLVTESLSDSEKKDNGTGIQVYIGNESPIQTMKDCSVVTATYDLGEGVKGTIGIVGPKRMDYEKVMDNLKTLKSQLDGIYKSEEDVHNYKNDAGGVVLPYGVSDVKQMVASDFVGQYKIKDVDNNGKIDANDRTFIGNPHPDLTGGVNLSLGWRGFDLSTYLYFSVGNDLFAMYKYYTHFGSLQSAYSKDRRDNSWHPQTNPDGIYPLWATTGGESDIAANQSNSGYIEDGSFLRMQTLTLGYTLPKKILDKIKFEKIRIYGQVANVFTITGYSGLDPQVRTDRDGGISNDRNMGTDFGAYGMPRQFIIGLNLTF